MMEIDKAEFSKAMLLRLVSSMRSAASEAPDPPTPECLAFHHYILNVVERAIPMIASMEAAAMAVQGIAIVQREHGWVS